VTTALADCCCVELALCDVVVADATDADELEGFEFVLLLGEDDVAALLLTFVADDALRMCSGINTLCRLGLDDNSCAEKLKSFGNSFPLGSLIPGSRSSSKNLCAHACKGVCLLPGVYSNNDDVSEIASAGVLALKTLDHGCGLI